jgi:hypothetical protein
MKPQVKINYNISNENRMKFHRFKCETRNVSTGSSRENIRSDSLKMNYNKNPLESIKIFKNIEDQRKMNQLMRKSQKDTLKIETSKKFNRDHNMEIINFNQAQTKQSRFHCNTQYGISFNTPAYIKFEPHSRRLQEHILIEKKCLDISGEIGIKKSPIKAQESIPLLGKRSSEEVNLRNNQPENSSSKKISSNQSFFGSSQSVSKNKPIAGQVFVGRSLDDKDNSEGTTFRNPFLSVKNLDSSEEKESGRDGVDQDVAEELFRQIKMADLKTMSNSNFRDTVIYLYKQFMVQEKVGRDQVG